MDTKDSKFFTDRNAHTVIREFFKAVSFTDSKSGIKSLSMPDEFRNYADLADQNQFPWPSREIMEHSFDDLYLKNNL